MNVMHDFIWIGFVELRATGSKRKSKWKYVPPRGIEAATLCIPAFCSNHSAIEIVNDMRNNFFLRYYQWTRVTMHVWNWFWLDVFFEPRAYEKGGRAGRGGVATGTRAPELSQVGGIVWFVPHFTLFVNELGHWKLTVRQNLHFFTNIDVLYYCLQNCIWTNQTIINYIHALSHVLIYSSVKSRLNV